VPDASTLYRPPAPVPTTPVRGLIRSLMRPERDLLGLTPIETYRCDAMVLGCSRRSILLVNAPELTGRILQDKEDVFPKNDVMVDTLDSLVGNSIFVSSGDTWRRQRRMVDPAFSAMRINRAFAQMQEAIDDFEARMPEATFSLDEAMSHLTADVICRTIFSRPLAADVSRDVFDDFAEFEKSVANIEIMRLLLDKPWAKVPQKPAVRAACQRIRDHLGAMLDARLATPDGKDDIAGAIAQARDADTGEAFTREELIDQLGVFFLAGHETTASTLTWAFFLLGMQPDAISRIREEVEAVTSGEEITFEHTKRLVFTRNVLRETMRLYPPITFLPRVAERPTKIGRFTVKRGTMVMISPWTIHRHLGMWPNPDRFDPDRFSPTREADIVPGSYLPFGLGPRICVGAAFATIETCLIVARLVRRFDITVQDADSVYPVSRLTTRPAREIMVSMRAVK
jgi:cytochrome P450